MCGESPTCPVCREGLDPDSPATWTCPKCGMKCHHACWAYAGRSCPRFGCDRPELTEEEQRVLGEGRGWYGRTPMALAVLIVFGLLALFFLVMAMETGP